VNQHRGEKFEQLQRESYGQLCGDLDFALYKVKHPVRTHSENDIVSLALKEIDGVSEMSCLDIGCGQGVATSVLSEHVDTA
jgi:2-polyprenyl-3-methyl-5-hydroxy-6-metoxy-1,4-benzoquinol methylase